MPKYDYSKLQNGSDIRGIALDGIPGEEVNLDAEASTRIGRAFLFWLSNITGKKPSEITIAIGRDPRLSGSDLTDAFCKGICSHGTKVLDAGIASTPAMFMSTRFPEYKCDGAVMVTASHLPFNRNGFKFFDEYGGLDKGDITDIITFAESDSMLNSMPPAASPEIRSIPLLDTYSAYLRNLIIERVNAGDKPLKGMKITVDAGNGSGGFYADKVLAPLGADISSSQYLEPDGKFPNHAPNPEDDKAIASICNAVKENHTDLGLIFDTDVDRASAVDENGHEINRNGIVALAAALIASEHPETTVVTDSITSNQLTTFLEKDLGLKHLRFKRGYKNVINKSKELNEEGVDSQLAIETSGHAAYKENFFLDDGAYLATKIVIKAAQLFTEKEYISSVISDLEIPSDSIELRFPVTVDNFSEYGDIVIKQLTESVENGFLGDAHLVLPNYEGVRISFDNPEICGWILLRKSLHDPIMPLNIESSVDGGCEKIKDILRPVLLKFEGIDSSKL